MATLLRLEQDDLERVMTRAGELGVHLETDITEDGGIWLGQITRGDGVAGSGRRVLEMLCEVADEAEVDIGLVVIHWCTGVVDLYSSLGFEQRDHDGVHDDDDYILMIREPQ